MLDEVRTSCAAVMTRARWVEIDHARVAAYAAAFTANERQGPHDIAIHEATTPLVQRPLSSDETSTGVDAATEATVALVVALDAINFGSGYHPVVRKRPGCSGAVTMATALRAWAGRTGPVTPDRLQQLTPRDTHEIFGQPSDDGPVAELMDLFATALNDLGRLVAAYGSFTAFVAAADRSADRLVHQLDQLAFYRDRALHDGHEVLFYKRAQITVADLDRELRGTGPGAFDDLDQLTAFADNLVPHVLRVDGVLRVDPDLVARIDREELLAAGSEEEVEIRAAGVHAVELLRAALRTEGHDVRSSRLDEVLWRRGGGPRYKAVARHRCRTVFY